MQEIQVAITTQNTISIKIIAEVLQESWPSLWVYRMASINKLNGIHAQANDFIHE